jgi:hypothetical protein
MVYGTVHPAEAAQRGNWKRTATHPVSMQDYERGDWGEYLMPTVLVVDSPDAWDQAMAGLAADGKLLVNPGRSSSDLHVDWAKYAVVLVAMGEQSSVGCEVTVREVRSSGMDLVVDADMRWSASGPQGMTSPYHMVLVPNRAWKSAMLRQDWEAAQSGARGARKLAAGSTAKVGGQVDGLTWGSLKGLYR